MNPVNLKNKNHTNLVNDSRDNVRTNHSDCKIQSVCKKLFTEQSEKKQQKRIIKQPNERKKHVDDGFIAQQVGKSCHMNACKNNEKIAITKKKIRKSTSGVQSRLQLKQAKQSPEKLEALTDQPMTQVSNQNANVDQISSNDPSHLTNQAYSSYADYLLNQSDQDAAISMMRELGGMFAGDSLCNIF